MGSELEINYGIAKIKVSLAEFAIAIKQISGAVKHQEVRDALKDMITEVRKSYDTTVDVFTPFYSMDTEKKFAEKFSAERETFKNKYLKDIGEVRSHCKILKGLLEDLEHRKSWMKNLPLVKKSFKRLKDLGEFWFLSDYTLANEMETFLKKLNKLLDSINTMKINSSQDAFLHLQSSLEQFEDDIKSLKKNLEDLRVISSKL